MKNRGLFLIFALLLLLSLVSATPASVFLPNINLKIDKTPISSIVISELNQPAKYIYNITNLGPTDNFEIYSLIGVDFAPKGTFQILSGETKSIEVDVYLPENIRKNTQNYIFTYKIRGQSSGIMDDSLEVRVVNFKDLFASTSDNINPDSTSAIVYLTNKENVILNDLSVKFTSAFFDFTQNASLKPTETAEFTVPINKDTKGLVAGKYLLESVISTQAISATLDSTITFEEESKVSGNEFLGGIFITERTVEKSNDGNVPSIQSITVTKNIISRLFTTFNIVPDKTERKGFFIYYTWQRNIQPGQKLSIKVRTNWTIPFFILLFLVVIAIALKLYYKRDVIVSKKVIHVRTKGGEFALKVVLSIKAKKFVENIKVYDKLPALVKLHQDYMSLYPDKIDEKNKRLEWNLGMLNPGEDRTFSYIVYSRVNVVGKFELPPTRVIYEREGKIFDAESNKVFFLAEPKHSDE